MSRFASGSVGAKRRTKRAIATQISAALNSCVPSCPPSVPNNSRFSGSLRVSGTDAAYDDLMEPVLSPPVSSVMGEIEFGRKHLTEADFTLAVAALNPSMSKIGKIVHIKHTHGSLAHAHTSAMQATARHHGFGLTGELVSC